MKIIISFYWLLDPDRLRRTNPAGEKEGGGGEIL